MKYFSKLGKSLIHPTNSLKENWKLAIRDPLFLLITIPFIVIIAFEIYMRYFQ